VAELVTEDAVLHVEVDGDGSPVTILGHGLSNSCRELAMFTPLVPGTKVRFCFRGHGHSSSPERGYRFADFARDFDAVARAYGGTNAFGTSLGAGAICHLIEEEPDRFEKLLFLLPAGIDLEFQHKDRMLRTAELIDGHSREEAIELLLNDPERLAGYLDYPFLRDLDQQLVADINPIGVPRAIREVIEDHPIKDRERLRDVTAPTLIIAREGDPIHPMVVAEILAELLPNAELLRFGDGTAMFEAIPMIVQRVQAFLAA
jgi:pimeloyl-ACP methyl ester carboxylesterase